jgi:hypothetical protein
MSSLMKSVLEKKARVRKELAALSFTEKVAILEKMRRRNQMLEHNP